MIVCGAIVVEIYYDYIYIYIIITGAAMPSWLGSNAT
jgi:hypothetical protein